MPVRYSYDSLTVFCTPDGQYGWVYHYRPTTVHHREGFDFNFGSEGYASFPEGLTEPPEGAMMLTFGHVPGGCAGERSWEQYWQPAGSEEQASDQEAMDRFLDECLQAVADGKMPPDPEGLLGGPVKLFEIEFRLLNNLREKRTVASAVRSIRGLLQRSGNEANTERVVQNLLALPKGKEMYVTYGVSIRRL